MPLPQHTLPIVGISHPNKRGPSRVFELEICQPGEAVELRPEPQNKADPYAVAVYSGRGIQLGYVPAERCARIGALIGQGRVITAIYQGRDAHRGYMRLAYDGEQPVLPPARSATQAEQDFWPDPTWDD